jgi:fructose 1,6-bisphosphatase
VYPNPAQNELIVDEMKKGTQLEIYTLDGKKIWNQKAVDTKEIINVSQWQRGNYILKAIYKKQQYSQKITIQ